jgi:hypothetical protein
MLNNSIFIICTKKWVLRFIIGLFNLTFKPQIYILYHYNFSDMIEEKIVKRFQVGEIKSAIIEYILKSPESFSEPTIREYLKSEYNIQDHGTINKHLHKLEELGCVESVKPDKKLDSIIGTLQDLKH